MQQITLVDLMKKHRLQNIHLAEASGITATSISQYRKHRCHPGERARASLKKALRGFGATKQDIAGCPELHPNFTV